MGTPGVGLQQSSVLSSLLFIIRLEALSREFYIGFLCELQYADDLMIIARVPVGLMAKTWKSGM